MANEIVVGATQAITFDSNPVKGKISNFSNAHAVFDSTNTSTANSGSESVAGRAKRTIKIDSDLYTPAGAKVTGATLAVSMGGSDFYALNASYDMNYAEHDATNTSTEDTSTQVVGGRKKSVSKFDVLMRRDVAEKIATTIPAPIACTITFATGVTVAGNVLLHQEDISDDVNGMVKCSYSGEWQGAPTETALSQVAFNDEAELVITYETGTATDKSLTADAVFLGISISSDANGDAKVTYSGVINGAITPSVYTAA